MKSSAKKIELASVDDLFSTEEVRQDAKLEKIQEIPLSELHPFKNHPFKVKDDEAMMETADSIKQYGVLVPAIARPDPEGGYELVGRLQIFRRRDSGAFFSSAADHPTDLTIQFHLRKLRRHKRVQCGEHGDVICGFANVHGLSPFRRGAPDQRSKQRKARRCHRVFLCFDLLQMTRTICSHSRMCFSSMALLS